MKKFVVLFFLSLGLAGCVHSKSDNDDASDELVGKWVSTCASAGAGQYSKLEMNMTGSSYSLTFHIYSDSNCTTLVFSSQPDSGTYKTGGTLTTTSGNKATEIDITISGGETYLDIFAIIDGKLYFGKDPGSNARPTALDFDFYFVKG